jgi:hypothetical protein
VSSDEKLRLFELQKSSDKLEQIQQLMNEISLNAEITLKKSTSSLMAFILSTSKELDVL